MTIVQIRYLPSGITPSMYIEVFVLIVAGVVIVWLFTRADGRHRQWWRRFSDANVRAFAERYMLTIRDIERDPSDPSRSIYYLESQDSSWELEVEIAYCDTSEPSWRNYMTISDDGHHAKIEGFMSMDVAWQQAWASLEGDQRRSRASNVQSGAAARLRSA